MSVSTWFASPFVRAFVVLAACAVLLLGAPPARADDPPPKPDRPWSVEVALGSSFGGPTEDIEDAMRAAGFDDTIEPGGYSYPQTFDSEWSSLWGAARRRLGDSGWLVGVGAGWTELGSVGGNRNVEGEPEGSFYIYSEVEMLTIAPMAWFQPLPAARLGVGLALNRVDTHLGRSYSGEIDDSSSWEPGLIVEAAVNAPVASRFYFFALLQYRWLQDGTIGPWQETASSGEVVVFPETDVTLSHGFVGAGVGIRF